jgi:hypothetical protein
MVHHRYDVNATYMQLITFNVIYRIRTAGTMVPEAAYYNVRKARTPKSIIRGLVSVQVLIQNLGRTIVSPEVSYQPMSPL